MLGLCITFIIITSNIAKDLVNAGLLTNMYVYRYVYIGGIIHVYEYDNLKSLKSMSCTIRKRKSAYFKLNQFNIINQGTVQIHY